MRRILVFALILSVTTQGFAETPKAAAARQKAAVITQQKEQQRVALANQAAAKKQALVAAYNAKKDPAKNSAVPKGAGGQTTPSMQNRDAAAAGLLLGVLVLGLALSGDSGGGFSSSQSESQSEYQSRFDQVQRHRRDYYQDRARQEAARGDFREAERSLESAK